MSLRHLKTFRRIASVILLCVISALFLDLRSWIPASVSTGILSFQLVPAIMRTLAGPGLWVFGIAFVILLTLLFGRVYCSSLCPLGTFQDLVIRFAKHRDRKKWFDYRKPDYGIHYAIVIAAGVAVAGGSMLIVDLLEPFSNFGRMVQGIARPLLVGTNNAIAWGLGWFGAYWLQAIPLPGLTASVILIPLAFATFVGWMAYTRGRLFCNLLCPAGALLSLAARFSFVKIAINTATCRDCGLCEMVCKAQCIDSGAKKIDFAACVSCFDCISACPTVGLEYRNPMERRKEPAPVDGGRRKMLQKTILPAAALLSLPGSTPTSDTLTEAQRAPRQLHPVTPPGSRGLDHFSSYCTACHLCISACPTQVLVPSILEYGAAGIFQPRMDYWISSCNYDCTICSTVCPSGAILPLSLEQKKLTQLGKAKFVREDCIVITKKADCGACSEHCPTKAVKMVPHEKLLLPEVNDEICIGCGACEHPCPTKPRKAIYVEANVVHLEAKKPPKVEKPKVEEKALEEFPF